MQAPDAPECCMKYTIRNIPPELDSVLRSEAEKKGKSLDQVIVEALMRAFGLDGSDALRRDIGFLVGSWDGDPEVERALEAQRQIDSELWS